VTEPERDCGLEELPGGLLSLAGRLVAFGVGAPEENNESASVS